MTNELKQDSCNVNTLNTLPCEMLEQWFQIVESSDRKGYSHFDEKVIYLCTVIGKTESGDPLRIYDWVMNPTNIVSHSFLPFIHYSMTFAKACYIPDGADIDKNVEKRIGDNLKLKYKTREIFYASHFDRCIYQYYSCQLNYFYNKWAKSPLHNIDNVAIAYRPNSGKSNIDYAKKAFDRIIELNKCLVIVSDFSSFFDNIDCDYLKSTMCEVLGVERLPDDWFAVFKSLTRHSWVDIDDIVTLLKSPFAPKPKDGASKGYNIRAINEWDKIPDIKTFKQMLHDYNQQQSDTSEHIVIMNRARLKDQAGSESDKLQADKGIPQGSPISAVMSNVYMIHFDEMVKQLVTNLNGLYMRYSDDLIIILPLDDFNKAENLYCKVWDCLSSFQGRVIINESKTNKLVFDQHSFYAFDQGGVDGSKKKNLSYLGFVFDGTKVKFRQSCITKYYYRMRKKARSYASQKNNNKIRFPTNLYQIYATSSPKFVRRLKESSTNPKKPSGNFLSYVSRAQKTFGADLNDPHAKALIHRSRQKVAKAIKEFRKKLKKKR